VSDIQHQARGLGAGATRQELVVGLLLFGREVKVAVVGFAIQNAATSSEVHGLTDALTSLLAENLFLRSCVRACQLPFTLEFLRERLNLVTIWMAG
jgi:hypothetical protein